MADKEEKEELANSHERSRYTGKAKIKGHKVNTVRSTQWSTRLWNEWSIAKNATLDPLSPQIPDIDNLLDLSKQDMDKTLSLFVEEIKRIDGTDYPAETLNGVMYGIQRYLRQFDPRLNIFEKITETYKLFQKSYDDKMTRLTENRVGLEHKKVAQGVTEEHEVYLWNNRVFNLYSAKGLSDTVFFYTSKVFGVIDGRAHRYLKTSDFKFGSENGTDYVELSADYAKKYLCRNHGIETPTHDLRQYHDENNPRSYYIILKYYINVITREISNPNCILFLQPGEDRTLNEIEFRPHAIGENSLQGKIGKMMKRAKVVGYFTNQSMMTSIATRLFGRGYSIRQSRGQYYNTDVHKAICKFLDPPVGPMEVNRSVKTHAVLKLVQPVTTSQAAIMYNQQPVLTVAPQLGTTSVSLVPQYRAVSSTGTSTLFLQLQQPTTPMAVVNQTTSLPIAQNPNHLQDSLSRILNKHKQSVLATKTQTSQTNVCKSSITKHKNKTASAITENSAAEDMPDADGSLAENEIKSEQFDEETNGQPEAPFPLYMSGVNGCGSTGGDNSMESALNDMPDVERIIVKEEPVDDEYENAVLAMETNRTLDQILNEDENTKSSSNLFDSEAHTAERNFSRGVKRKSEYDDSTNDGADKHRFPETNMDYSNSAEIEFVHSKVDNKIKQQVTITDNEQTVFSINTQNRSSRSIPDLDINLGDYMPENSTMRPEDISIRRITTSSGEKLVFSIKYCKPADPDQH